MQKEKLYNLCIGEQEQCFQSFNPADYTEIEGYIKNTAFQGDETRSLLSIANKALMFFTRADSEYEADTKTRYSHITARKQKKLDKRGEVAFPAFSMVPFQAFKRDRGDFEEAVRLCCKHIRDVLDEREWTKIKTDVRTGFDDAEFLDSTLRDEFFESVGPFEATDGLKYDRPHLLGVFALWKIDRAVLAVQNGMAADVANLLTDAQSALSIADECYRQDIQRLYSKKQGAERQADAGKASHKNLEDVRDTVVAVYTNEGKIKKWRSVRMAAAEIFDRLAEEDQKKFVSPEGAKRTISEWITDADPQGQFSSYKKKVPVSRST